MRTRTARFAAFALIATIGNAVATSVSCAQGSVAPTFTKQAFDANGAPLTGPPQAGQTIHYVLSYSAGTSTFGPVTIDDTLSANQTYLSLSIAAPPGWTWTLPGYSPANHETYSNPGFGPGTSFIVNVPGGVGQAAQGGGDGFAPIPVPAVNSIAGVFHHELPGAARITCWDEVSLGVCPGYSKTLDPPGDPRSTPQKPLAVANGTTVYFPSSRYDAAAQKTYLGIGCFNMAGTGAPCAFIDLPGMPSLSGSIQVGGQALNPYLAGVVADPTHTRLFVYAIDRVHCIDISGISPAPCAGFASPTLTGTGTQTHLIAAEGTSRLIVMYGVTSGNKATLTCLDRTTGARCAGWIVDPQAPATSSTTGYGALSVVPDAAGTTIAVCLHPYGGSNSAMECYDMANGTVSTAANVAALKTAMLNKFVIDSFHIPGTQRVLYGQYTSPMSCFDFAGAGAPCTPFTPYWGPSTANFNFKDYGYAVDPTDAHCLLGLGHAGELWRFARDGTACTTPVKATFDINSFFCAKKPTKAAWGSIIIHNRPTQLTGGVVTLVNSNGQTVSTTTVGAANTYPVNIPATGANSQLTLQFVPTYGSGPPANGYQLELTFTADVDPQICYQATVACGPVSNNATMAGSIVGAAAPVPYKASASVDLGTATGPSCQSDTPALLKVCKVAGPGISVGTPFTFTAASSAGSNTFTVPAGPAPGGTCVIGPKVAAGTTVTVGETIPPGDTVSNITVAPPGQVVAGTVNLAGGSVNVLIGSGVTEVTFTDKRTGFLEICKIGDVKGSFNFTVNPGALGPFAVPAGACSPAIEVAAGSVLISEQLPAGYVMIGCSTFPAAQQGACNPSAQTSTVIVAAGDVSTETVAFITNRPAKGVTETGEAPAPR